MFLYRDFRKHKGETGNTWEYLGIHTRKTIDDRLFYRLFYVLLLEIPCSMPKMKYNREVLLLYISTSHIQSIIQQFTSQRRGDYRRGMSFYLPDCGGVLLVPCC